MRLRLFVLLACLFVLLSSREPPWADAHVVYDTTRALVDQGRLDVTLDGHPWFFAVQHGKKYGVFPLGNVLALVPGYVSYKLLALTQLFPDGPLFALCSHLPPALLMAGAAVVLFGLLRRRGASDRMALVLSLTMGLSTLLFCYSRVAYCEALQTLLLLLLIRAALRAAELPRAGRFAQVGAWAGALLNSKLVYALLLPVVLIYVYWPMLVRDGRSLRARLVSYAGPSLAALGAFVPFVAFAMWHNWVKTGSPWLSGYAVPGGVFSGDLLPGLYGYLFSTGKSLFLYSPPLLLCWLGMRRALAHRPAESRFFVAVFVTGLLWNAKFRIWHGDYCWGPRLMSPFIPLLLLLLVPWLPEALARGRQRLRCVLFSGLLTLGCAVQLLGATFYWDHYIRILIAIKDQTGAAGWFHEQLGHGHYVPQFSPLRGHLWMLSHHLRQDLEANHDAPWRLIVPNRVDLSRQLAALRPDLIWIAMAETPKTGPRHPLALPLWLLLLCGGAGWAGVGLRRRTRRIEPRG
jgi:hypothetical protein